MVNQYGRTTQRMDATDADVDVDVDARKAGMRKSRAVGYRYVASQCASYTYSAHATVHDVDARAHTSPLSPYPRTSDADTDGAG